MSTLCPKGEKRIYKTISREGYRHYDSDSLICANCSEQHRGPQKIGQNHLGKQ